LGERRANVRPEPQRLARPWPPRRSRAGHRASSAGSQIPLYHLVASGHGPSTTRQFHQLASKKLARPEHYQDRLQY